MSNRFDPDQDRHSVGPDLGQNCLEKLSTDDKSQLAREELNEPAQYLESLEVFCCKHSQYTVVFLKEFFF